MPPHTSTLTHVSSTRRTARDKKARSRNNHNTTTAQHRTWVENVNLVALHNLWGRVVVVIVRRIVLVPLVSSLDAVEVPRFSRSELVIPSVDLTMRMKAHTHTHTHTQVK